MQTRSAGDEDDRREESLNSAGLSLDSARTSSALIGKDRNVELALILLLFDVYTSFSTLSGFQLDDLQQ